MNRFCKNNCDTLITGRNKFGKCIACGLKSREKWRQKHLPFEADRQYKYRINKAPYKYMVEMKNKPCADCHIQYHFSAMDFDHLPKFKKNFGIAQGALNASLQEIKAEIAKCEVVCSNCHRVRSWKRNVLTSRVNPDILNNADTPKGIKIEASK